MGQAGCAADGKEQWKGQLVQLVMQSLGVTLTNSSGLWPPPANCPLDSEEYKPLSEGLSAMSVPFQSLPLLLAGGPRALALAALSMLASPFHATRLSLHSCVVHLPINTINTGDRNCKL